MQSRLDFMKNWEWVLLGKCLPLRIAPLGNRSKLRRTFSIFSLLSLLSPLSPLSPLSSLSPIQPNSGKKPQPQQSEKRDTTWPASFPLWCSPVSRCGKEQKRDPYVEAVAKRHHSALVKTRISQLMRIKSPDHPEAYHRQCSLLRIILQHRIHSRVQNRARTTSQTERVPGDKPTHHISTTIHSLLHTIPLSSTSSPLMALPPLTPHITHIGEFGLTLTRWEYSTRSYKCSRRRTPPSRSSR